MAIVFMPLLQDGTDTWRPIEVTPLQGGIYRVEGSMPDNETWQFTPGSEIQIRWKKFADGSSRLIPKGPAPSTRSIFTDYLRRSAGIFIGAFPQLLIMKWLPRQPDGRLDSAPLLLTSVALALLAAILLIWRRPDALVFKWAVWFALGFGILLSCLSLIPDTLG